MEKIVESFELFGKTYRFETGELAKQATGAVLVTQGDTTVLVTAVISKEEKNYDFFPLTVDFMEKMYSVGRIPGGYLKREARPSEKGTLTARMIDRPIRPGFVDGFKREVHIVATTLVCDGQNPPDCICVGGASAALMLGSAPFDGPAACVRIAHNPETDEFIVNPTYAEQETSDLELTIAGTADYISMVEAGANEVTEDLMLRVPVGSSIRRSPAAKISSGMRNFDTPARRRFCSSSSCVFVTAAMSAAASAQRRSLQCTPAAAPSAPDLHPRRSSRRRDTASTRASASQRRL